MWACWTEAIWRPSKSDCVTMSPFTLTITRSSTSARAARASSGSRPAARAHAAARAAGRRRLGCGLGRLGGFMIHLGTGHQALDELVDTLVGLLAQQQRADLVPALLQA